MSDIDDLGSFYIEIRDHKGEFVKFPETDKYVDVVLRVSVEQDDKADESKFTVAAPKNDIVKRGKYITI